MENIIMSPKEVEDLEVIHDTNLDSKKNTFEPKVMSLIPKEIEEENNTSNKELQENNYSDEQGFDSNKTNPKHQMERTIVTEKIESGSKNFTVVPSFNISDDEYWKEDKNIPIIVVNDSFTKNEINSSPIIWNEFDNIIQNSDNNDKNNINLKNDIDTPLNNNNDYSIDPNTQLYQVVRNSYSIEELIAIQRKDPIWRIRCR